MHPTSQRRYEKRWRRWTSSSGISSMGTSPTTAVIGSTPSRTTSSPCQRQVATTTTSERLSGRDGCSRTARAGATFVPTGRPTCSELRVMGNALKPRPAVQRRKKLLKGLLVALADLNRFGRHRPECAKEARPSGRRDCGWAKRYAWLKRAPPLLKQVIAKSI